LFVSFHKVSNAPKAHWLPLSQITTPNTIDFPTPTIFL